MKVRFKVNKQYADSIIIGLAKSCIPVTCYQEVERMIKPGDVYITADFMPGQDWRPDYNLAGELDE